MRPTTQLTALLLAASCLTACAADTLPRRDLVADPGLSDRGASRHTRFLGYIPFDSIRAGGFVRDEQFDGYGFYARKDATITLEVPEADTKRNLDTTLFVYGPLNSGDVKEVAWDDDGGPGSLSKIENLTMPEDGEYLVIVGTALGTGRGAYNVALWCDADGCDPSDDRPAGCEIAVSDWVNGCTWQRMPIDGNDEDLYKAFDACTNDDSAAQSFTALCENPAGGLSGIFCGTFDGYFDSTWAACKGVLTPSDRPILQ